MSIPPPAPPPPMGAYPPAPAYNNQNYSNSYNNAGSNFLPPPSNNFGDNRGGNYNHLRGNYGGNYNNRGNDRGNDRGDDRGNYGNNNNGRERDYRGGNDSSRGGNSQKLAALDFNTIQLSAFNRNFYQEHPDLANVSEDEVNALRASAHMTVVGNNIPKPVRSFAESGFPHYILDEITKSGFAEPTPIQKQGWPMALSGRDVIGISATGSGKTLCFLLPAIVHINNQPIPGPGDGPVCLVLSPTRELANQISEQCDRFCKSSNLEYTCVYGGVKDYDQVRSLRKGVDILIATPGRLIDLLEKGATNLKRVTYLVLDEADRMLDMGFTKQIQVILGQIRPDRQTLLWSATWPREIQTLAQDYTVDPIQVFIGTLDLKANKDITQEVRVINNQDKMGQLKEVLLQNSQSKAIIFVARKHVADSVCDHLKAVAIRVDTIHGDKSQDRRDRALDNFKTNKIRVLVATDVAARGIDVKDIELVVNFDMPGDLESYVHRIGRTGRAGKTGHAITFFTREDGKRAFDLVKLLKQTNQAVPTELEEMSYRNNASNARAYGGSFRGSGGYSNGSRGYR